MQHPEATNSELGLSVRSYNSLGHWEKPQAGNGPPPSPLSLQRLVWAP